MPSHPMAFLRAAPYHQSTSTAPCLLQLPTKQKPRANQKTELKPRAITRFDQKPRENKKTETKLRATTLFKRPPTRPRFWVDPRVIPIIHENEKNEFADYAARDFRKGGTIILKCKCKY